MVSLRSSSGDPVPVQTTVLDRWSDSSVRWLLVDWRADGEPGQLSRYQLTTETSVAPDVACQLGVLESAGGVTVDTGMATFVLQPGTRFPFQHVTDRSGRALLDPEQSGVLCEDESGVKHALVIHEVAIERRGPLRATISSRGRMGTSQLEIRCVTHFYADSPVVSFELTLRNPRRAEHRGGIWTLGDPGSLMLRELSLALSLGVDEVRNATISIDPSTPAASIDLPFEIYQDSSGGEHWKSSVHVNRRGEVMHQFRGYRVRTNRGDVFGLRATPTVHLASREREWAAALPEFWQTFPKAVAFDGTALTLSCFPRQAADLHELQGGEQTTTVFAIAFGPDRIGAESLEWVRAPAVARCAPEWYAASGVVPYLTPLAEDRNQTYVDLCYAVVDGPDTFEAKRERIDEYGWRHYGDIYADHEAIHAPGRLVSHYNNQYDAIAGFAYQFMRSGDSRWWLQMLQLARHVVDIDIYHTTADKVPYNHGLFWHTVHYIDAGTSTHRSYPRADGVEGGGPASDHNYTTGLKLHYLMTGATWSREAAIDLGTFVIDRDDPRATPLWWIDRGYTGLASLSQASYHGPGRAAGNSVNALVDAYELTNERRYLDKTEQLIRRCVHPAENIERHELRDAERRWFYTMMLQAVGKYLDVKAEREQFDFMYGYAQASLLHYARWMAAHERPYLDHPEQLEFPTESWAAMDMRKSDVFKYAARHGRLDERRTFLERSDFFFRTSTETLARMPTRTLARPAVMMLTHGFMHAWFQQPAAPIDAVVAPPADYGTQEEFRPQMEGARKRLTTALALSGLAALAFVGWWLLLRTT
jgi:hypothetical protein